MTAVPVSVLHIEAKKELFANIDLIAAIDRGCCLIKLLFASKSDYEASKTQDTITLTLELFATSEFEAAIDSMLRQMHIPENAHSAVLRVTGAGAEREMQLLRERTSFKIDFVDEFYAQAKGTHALLKHFQEDEVLHPRDPSDVWDMSESVTFIDHMTDAMKSGREIALDDSCIFPCVVGVLGSACYFLLVKEDGSAEFLGNNPLGGKCLLGLGKLLLNTKDYNEITQLALTGDLTAVDSQVKEYFSNSGSSSYGQFDSDLPIWPFGKVADFDKELEDIKREDMALSLVSVFISSINMTVASSVAVSRCSRVYLTGNICAAPLTRYIMALQRKAFSLTKLFSLRFLKTGHTGAMGALLADSDGRNFW